MKLKLPSRDDVEIDMAPMIDLVFLLLIFFMVASVVTENKVEVEIPTSKFAKVPENIEGRMMVSVDANNQIYVNLQPVSIEELKTMVNDGLDANEDLRILIRADGNVEYKTCKEIMIACGEVGATDLIYATYESASAEEVAQ